MSIEDLLKYPHIVAIQQAEKWTPVYIDYSHFKDSASKIVDTIQGFISSPYIVDDFETDHAARRQFRSSLDENAMELFNSNPLRVNNWRHVSFMMEILASDYQGRYKSEYREMARREPAGAAEYHVLSTAEKIDYVRQWKHLAYAMISFVPIQKRGLKLFAAKAQSSFERIRNLYKPLNAP